MIFHTESGSIYEIDEPNKCVRRLTGSENPTPRQGKDGDWKKYDTILTPPKLGSHAVIIWRFVGGIAESTMTSKITKFQNDSEIKKQ